MRCSHLLNRDTSVMQPVVLLNIGNQRSAQRGLGHHPSLSNLNTHLYVKATPGQQRTSAPNGCVRTVGVCTHPRSLIQCQQCIPLCPVFRRLPTAHIDCRIVPSHSPTNVIGPTVVLRCVFALFTNRLAVVLRQCMERQIVTQRDRRSASSSAAAHI